MTTILPTAGDTDGDEARQAPHAVLLDMDGTLVDTEGLWWEAEVEVFAELGHTLAERHRDVVVGGPMDRSAGYLLEVTGAGIGLGELVPRLNAAFLRRVDRGVTLLPGAERLLGELAAQRVPTALVSASDRAVVDRIVGTVGAHHFRHTVAGGELSRNKPHPDPYLAAAEYLGAVPDYCVAVEDTATGVAAAEAAGCRVLAVPSLAPIAPADRRAVVPSLVEIDLAALRALWDPTLAPVPVTPPPTDEVDLPATYWPGRTSPLS